MMEVNSVDANLSFGEWTKQEEPVVNFIIKIYSIITFQLIISITACFISILSEGFAIFLQDNIWLLSICFILVLIINLTSIWHYTLYRDPVFKFFILLVFALSQAYIISYISISTYPVLILSLVFMTFSFILALILFYSLKKMMFSICGGIFFSSLIAILLFVLFFFLSDLRINFIILSSLWVILYGMYIIYDTQLILGNSDNKLEQIDYILVSFWFNTDVILIFGSLFQIFNFMRNQEDDKQHN